MRLKHYLFITALVCLAGVFLFRQSPLPSEPPTAISGAQSASAVAFQKPDPAEATRLAAERLASQPMGHAACDAFTGWASRFIAAEQGEKKRLVDEGIALATARRIELKSLIVTDPRTAIANAVPPLVRQLLPRAIAERLEERVNEQSFFGVLGALPGAGSEVGPPIRREVRTSDGGVYRAFVFGRRAEQGTTENASILGIAVDNYMAVDERPLRAVEAGEIPNHANNRTRRRTVVPVDDQGFSQDKIVREDIASPRGIVGTCPVSGKSTSTPQREDGTAGTVEPGQPVVEAGGQFHYLCSGGHIVTLEEDLIAAEGGNGGPRKPLSAPAATQGTGYKSHLLMRVAFPESRKPSVTEKEGHDLGKGVQDWFLDTSFGAMTFMTTVTPTIIMPRTEAWYTNADPSSADQVLSDARAASKAAGFDPANFDFDTVIYTGSPGGFGGQAYVGGKGCWLKSGTGVGVACHEYGHNFGLWHANYWDTAGVSTIGTGTHSEYGDSFDTMGSASAGDLQFNSYQKNLLNWMPTAVVSHVGASGTYRIYQMDQPAQNPALRYALKIRKDSDRDYWVDLRRKFTSNAWVQGGVFLHWSPWLPSAGGSHLLDATPGSPDGKTDAPLVIGRTFSDMESGIHITPTAKYATAPPSMDVVVNFGAFAGNTAPTLSLSASSTTVATSAVVTFTATGNDGDGDALSYAWDFGDKSFSTANAAVVTMSWSTAGEYAVRCVVSDMKGGTGSATVVVRVGSPTVYRVTGTITLGGLPQANVRVHNGLTGASYRGSFSNSDGTYTIANLSAGTYAIGAALAGFTFAGGTSVTVSPNAVVNFTAADATRVSISVPDNVVSEGADTGTIRLTRTGSTTSALAVNLYAQTGSATKTTDYTMSPDVVFVSPYFKFTIPAGEATLDVTLTAATDSTTEGTEFAKFEVVPGAGYSLGTASATVVIEDANSTKPLVRMTTPDNDAAESGAGGKFLIERTGSTAASLAVAVALSGTATSATDYTAIPTTITISAGSATAEVNVAPITDSAVEIAETVILTISANASLYNRAASSSDYAGTVTISDSNLPTLTVVAADASASEALNDPGVFVVTRTGSTAAALTVNYGITGSALHGPDFVPIPGQLTIPAGSAVGSVVITPIDDSIGEPTQTVVMQLRSGNGYILGVQSNASVSIVDNGDLPYASISVSTGPAKESGTAGVFKITTTGTGAGNISVLYTVTGAAEHGVDFATLSGSVSMAKNTTATFNVTPIQDLLAEGYETVTITLTPDPAYSLALDTSATLNLEDDEMPQVNVSTTNVGFSEAAGQTAHFFISRTGSTTAALTVNYTMSGTATSGTDYTAPTGSLTIAAAATGAYVDIPILADSLAEGTETITLDATPDSAYVLGLGSATRYLADAQSLALTTQFSATTSTVAENVGTTNLNVTLNSAAATPVTVSYIIGGGTSLAGVDYTLAPQTLTFEIGETLKTISVAILDDALDEPNETAAVTLVNASGAKISAATHTITITDDDTPPPVTIGFSGLASSGVESVSPAQIIIVLSNPQATAVTVDFAATGGTATDGSDYTITAGTLTFAAGETAKVLPNTITNDATLESAETIIVTLSNPTVAMLSANTTHTYTITDDDDVNVSIAASIASASEPSIGGQFTITRTGATTTALTVALTASGTATGGSDYAAIPVSAIIPIGASSVNIPVAVMDDVVGEGSETAIVAIAAGPYTIGTPGSATVTIADDEPNVSILAGDANAAEAALEPGSIVISRTGSTAAALTVGLTVGGTAVSGTDYNTVTVPAVIPVGSGSVTLTVTPVDDATAEGVETAVFTLNAGAYMIFGSPSATLTIADDDINNPPVIAITSPTSSNFAIPSGVGLLIEAIATDDGKPIPTGTLTTTWSKVSGPGTVTFGNAATPTTSAIFSASGVYVLRLTANDGGVQDAKDLRVCVGLAASSSLTAGDVGAVGVAGSYSVAGGVYTLNGSGTSVTSGSTADQCFFVRENLTGTSWDIVAHIASRAGGSSTSSRCGIMARAGTATDAMHAFMCITSDGRASFISRTTTATNSAASNSAVGSASIPRWVRLTRSGNVLTGFHSADGTTWTQQSTATIAIGDPVLVGLAITSAANTTLATVTFDDVKIALTDNTAPLVNAGPSASATLPQYAALDGTASDDALPAASVLTTTWVKATGPGVVTFADPDVLATTASFSAPGSYVLRLIADDGAVKTFDDTTAIATLPVISIASTIPAANEAGPVAGEFTITRAGSSDFALTARYGIGGTATNGVDADMILDAADIPIGSSTATIPVQPMLDALVEGSETVLLTLAADPAYTLGASTSATVTISDAPVVSVVATDATAAEFGPSIGTYTVSRSGSMTSALTVGISTTGSASPANDYLAPAPTVTISIGAASAAVILTPIVDSIAEGPETATINLAVSTEYAVGVQAAGTVTIADLPVDAWRWAQFGAAANSPAAADAANAANDGLNNLLKYAMNLDPLVSSTPPQTGIEAGMLTLTYRRNLAATDITFTLQESSNLSSWSTATPTEQILSDDGITRVIKVKVPVGAGSVKYLRLHAQRP